MFDGSKNNDDANMEADDKKKLTGELDSQLAAPSGNRERGIYGIDSLHFLFICFERAGEYVGYTSIL